MDYYIKSVNNNNNDKIELEKYHSRQKYATSSLDKIYSKSVNSDITFEEIDENIKQCYTNLQFLKNTFKKSKIGLIKSSIIKTNKNNCNVLNVDSLIKKFQSNNKNNNNIVSRNNLKCSNSSKNLTESYQKPIININNDLQNNNILKNTNDNSYYSIINKFRPFSPSTSLNNSNRNFFNSPNNYTDKNNLLHNSFSNKETLISFLQKQNDENKNKKKNKDLLEQYQEIKKKNYKKFMSDNLNSSLNEDIDYKKKYNECLEQIENLKNSLLDYEKNNRKLKETISSLTSILNNPNEEKNKNKIKELIKKYKKELNIANSDNKKLKEENNKLINEIQVLSNENNDLSKKISVLIDVIKTRDNVILNLQKVQNLKTDSELSCFDSIDDKTKIYRRKSLKDFSLDKDKKDKYKNKKHIEEIILKLPKYNRNGKIIEFPGKKFSYNELLKENEENKIKINMLNTKLQHYSLIQKKYEDMIMNQQTKEDETISRNFISSSATPIQTLLNEIKTEDINIDNYNFNSNNNNNDNKNLNIYSSYMLK